MTASSPASPPREPLVRRLGMWGIWALAVNGMIGAGISGTPGKVAAEAGLYSPLIFLLCGLLLAPVVLTFAEVSSNFRRTGGPVLYTQTAFGPFVGFQVGWAFYIARLSASAANISLIVTTLGWFWPEADTGAWRPALLLTLCFLLTWVNIVGTRQAMQAVGILTALKFMPILVAIVLGLMHFDVGVFERDAELPGLGATGAAVMIAIYAFVGWESALVPAGESRNPGRDMPRALLWALGMVTVLYVLVQAISISAVPDLATTRARPLIAVGEALLGTPGAVILTVGVILSVGGNVASATMSTPRITYALARDGLLPRLFGAVHVVYQTPATSIAVYGLFTFGLAVSGRFVELAMISVLTRLLIYLAVVLAAPRLRRRADVAPERWQLRGGLLIPGFAVAVCLALLVQVDLETVGRTAIYLAVGSVFYLLARRGRAA